MTVATDIEDAAVVWFARLRDTEASEIQWLAFVEWMEADQAHRAAYDAVERAWLEAGEASGRMTPPVVQRPANDDAPVRRRWLLGGLAVAASAAIAVGVWSQISLPSVTTFESADLARTVTLADGSTVWLNRGAELEARLGRRVRDIRLAQGEAAFDVKHDASRPFIVHAGDHEVRVLGTAFNVIHQGPRFVVQVERGVVAVKPAGGRAPTRLGVGQRLRQSGDGPITVNADDASAIIARRDGVLVYREETLADVADDLSLYLGKPVIVEGAARNLRFSGVLKADDEATVLGQLEAFAPVRITAGSSEIHISAR